jgi:hypothetical protein
MRTSLLGDRSRAPEAQPWKLPLAQRPACGFVVSFQNFFRQQATSCEIIRQKVNKAAVLAKDLPFFARKLLRKLEKLDMSRRLVQFKSRHIYCQAICAETLLLASLVFALIDAAE